jgi:DNA-directed RNA polymerase specialized sigma24 family protein
MVADALPVFTKAVFQDRRWSPDGKASLKTYFVNACILQFPALYREWLDQRRAIPAGLEIDLGRANPALDPALTVVLQDEAARMLDKISDPRIQEVVVLRGAGYTAKDAARRAGLTEKAAEGRLARIRPSLKDEHSTKPPAGNGRSDTTAQEDGGSGEEEPAG